MTCGRFYFSLLDKSTTSVYGILFIWIGVVAGCGNTIAAHILWKSDMTTKSNKILKSLAIADVLVGFVSCPVFVYQLLTRSFLNDCTFENIRNQLALCLGSTSALNIVLVAFDRYILMTRLTNYGKFMSNSKLNALISSTWVIPPLMYSLRYMNYTVYRVVFLIGDAVTLLLITISYILVMNQTRQMKKRLKKHGNRSAVSSYQIQLSKNITIIVTCFILCTVPALVTVLLGYIYEPGVIRSVHIQQAYLFSFFASSFNSCINPFIYAWKFPRFKQHLLRMFNRQSAMSTKYKDTVVESRSSGVKVLWENQ